MERATFIKSTIQGKVKVFPDILAYLFCIIRDMSKVKLVEYMYAYGFMGYSGFFLHLLFYSKDVLKLPWMPLKGAGTRSLWFTTLESLRFLY